MLPTPKGVRHQKPPLPPGRRQRCVCATRTRLTHAMRRCASTCVTGWTNEKCRRKNHVRPGFYVGMPPMGRDASL